jgi:hypothetical protein
MLPSVNHIKRLQDIDEQERKLAIERALTLQKAYNSGDVNTIYKAEEYYTALQKRSAPNVARKQSVDNPTKALILDPMEVATSMGYYSKASHLSYEALRSMGRTPVISAIIRTRKNQVADFLKPQPDKYSKGFVIKKKGIDKDEDLSTTDRKAIEKLTEFLLNCGEMEQKWKWDRFDTFGRKLVEDSLVLDQACFEVVPYRNLEPYAFTAVDGATFRIADSIDNVTGIHDSQKVNGEYPSYVQVWQNTIIREFYPWELCFGIRNPNTNIRKNGYGTSELEDLITTVTGMLNADKYNGSFFRQGSSPKGMLMIKKAGAALDNNRIAEFRKNWNNSLSGVENSHKVPILDAEGFEWIDMQKNNRDMEFFKYIEYLVKVGCAVFNISPEEIGFPLQGQGSGGLGSNSSHREEKLYSIDKGLKPLLTAIEHWINDYIVGPKTNNTFEFKFTGIQIDSPKEEEDRLTKAVTLYLTPDEVRRERGLKPLPNGMGKMPLNPILSQQAMMAQQQQQQQQQEERETQSQSEDQEFNNTNPFLDKGEDSPFVRSFEEYVKRELLAP